MPEAYLQCIKELEDSPNNNLLWNEKMLIEIRYGKWDDAMQSFQKIVDLGLSGTYLYDLKDSLEKIGPETLLNFYNHAIPLIPVIFLTPYFERGKIYLEKKEFQKALDDFDFYLSNHDYDWDVVRCKIQALKNLDREKAERYAREMIEYIDENLQNPELLLLPKFKEYHLGMKASIYAELEHYDEALDIYDELIGMDKNNYSAWYGKESIYKKLGQDDKLIEMFTQQIAMNTDQPMRYAKRAVTYKRMGQIDNAIKDFDTLVILRNSGTSYNTRARFFHNLHRYDEAIRDYDKALELGDVNRADVYFNKSNASYSLKKYPEALEHIEKGISLGEENNREDIYLFYERKATFLLKLGRYNEAEKWFLRSLEGKSDFYGALYNLACNYGLQGNVEKAVEFLKKANDVDPKALEEAKTDKDFDGIRKDKQFESVINSKIRHPQLRGT